MDREGEMCTWEEMRVLKGQDPCFHLNDLISMKLLMFSEVKSHRKRDCGIVCCAC